MLNLIHASCIEWLLVVFRLKAQSIGPELRNGSAHEFPSSCSATQHKIEIERGGDSDMGIDMDHHQR